MKRKSVVWLLCCLSLCLLLPGLALADTANAVSNLADGSYTVEVELGGGTGRASITSPARLTVQGGQATARIEWDSDHYDYMKLDGQTYLPVEGAKTSTFDLPVPAFNEPIVVIADTTAMSTPHEIEYTLTFNGATVRSGSSMIFLYAVGCAVLVLAVFMLLFRRKTPAKANKKGRKK